MKPKPMVEGDDEEVRQVATRSEVVLDESSSRRSPRMHRILIIGGMEDDFGRGCQSISRREYTMLRHSTSHELNIFTSSS
jgi:hypothetical protein